MQDTVPFVPAGGTVQVAVGPVSCVIEMNVVPLGRGSLKTTFCTVSGPPLAAMMVQVMVLLPPLLTVVVAGAIFWTVRSADDARTDAVPTLFSEVESVVLELTVALLMYIFAEIPGGTCPVSVNEALAPALSVKIEQVTVPFEPTGGAVEQSNAGPEFCIIETKVMSSGRMSCSPTVCAAFGPAFPTVITNATSVFGPAFEGPFFVTVRSASVAPGVDTTAVLELFSSFGSKVDVTLAMLVNVIPSGVSDGMCITIVKSPLEPAGNDAMLQVMLPVEAPGAGVKQLKAGVLL